MCRSGGELLAEETCEPAGTPLRVVAFLEQYTVDLHIAGAFVDEDSRHVVVAAAVTESEDAAAARCADLILVGLELDTVHDDDVHIAPWV